MASEDQIEKRCNCKKKSGIVRLSPTGLKWTPDRAADGGGRSVLITDIESFKVTKETPEAIIAGKALIKINLSHGEKYIKLEFGGNFLDRDAVQHGLQRLHRDARNGMNNSSSGTEPKQAALADNANFSVAQPRRAPPDENNNSSGAQPQRPPLGKNNNSSIAQPQRAPVGNTNRPSNAQSRRPRRAALDQAEEQWRMKILGQRDVQQMHVQLVPSGDIEDDEFFRLNKYKFNPKGERRRWNNSSQDPDGPKVGRNKGVRSDSFFNAGGSTGINSDRARREAVHPDNWPRNGIPTTTQRHRLFLLFPAISRAYSHLISAEGMTELEFWTTLKASTLNRKLRPHLNHEYVRNRAMDEAHAKFTAFFATHETESRIEDEERVETLDKSLDFRKLEDHRSPHVLEGHSEWFSLADTKSNSRRIKKYRPVSSHLSLIREVNQHGTLIVDDSTVEKRQAWKESATEKQDALLGDLVEKKKKKLPTVAANDVDSALTKLQTDNDVLMEDDNGFHGHLNTWTSSRRMDDDDDAGSVLANLLSEMKEPRKD